MRRAIICLAALTLVTGCGSGSSSTTASESQTSAASATTTSETETAAQPTQTATSTLPKNAKHTVLTGVETEFSIKPDKTKIPVGFLTLKGVNKGKVTHIFEIEGPGSENETPEIAPGKSASIELTLRTPGKYILYCPIDNHKQKGMLAHIEVVP